MAKTTNTLYAEGDCTFVGWRLSWYQETQWDNAVPCCMYMLWLGLRKYQTYWTSICHRLEAQSNPATSCLSHSCLLTHAGQRIFQTTTNPATPSLPVHIKVEQQVGSSTETAATCSQLQFYLHIARKWHLWVKGLLKLLLWLNPVRKLAQCGTCRLEALSTWSAHCQKIAACR